VRPHLLQAGLRRGAEEEILDLGGAQAAVHGLISLIHRPGPPGKEIPVKQVLLALGVLLAFSGPFLPGDDSHRDPLSESLFPPELILRFQAEIGLTGGEREAIMEEAQKAAPRFDELHRRLKEAAGELASLVQKERVDESAALRQLDKVQDLERELKRAHLSLTIGLKNRLSPEQQTRLQALRRTQPSPALKPLQETRKDRGAEKKEDFLERPEEKAPPTASRTPGELRADIEGLFAAGDVPWRRIKWHDCLLEGLKEAREKKRPLLFWVFIDRPAGDRRC
jgi:hypothetical protein